MGVAQQFYCNNNNVCKQTASRQRQRLKTKAESDPTLVTINGEVYQK